MPEDIIEEFSFAEFIGESPTNVFSIKFLLYGEEMQECFGLVLYI